jgi:hypothetical protein
VQVVRAIFQKSGRRAMSKFLLSPQFRLGLALGALLGSLSVIVALLIFPNVPLFQDHDGILKRLLMNDTVILIACAGLAVIDKVNKEAADNE